MSQILLLTNNPMSEYPIEKRLRQLGHEVFTSKILIDFSQFEKYTSTFLTFFNFIIMSETISNNEVKRLAKRFSTYSIPIIRKSDEVLDDLQIEEWKDFGIVDQIGSRPTIEVLREKISFDIIESDKHFNSINRKRPISTLSLSYGELKLFKILFEEYKQTVSREDLCLKMWDRDNLKSSMSQLSVMVKSLKTKLLSQGIKGPVIETCWGRGYRLHESVYNQISIDEKELEYIY